MISNLDPSSQLFLANLDRVQQTISTANAQVSSGKKISSASDAPDQIGSLLQLRAQLQHNSQIQTNLTSAQADATAADSAISSAISMMDQALTLGEQGANSTQTSDVLANLAQQVEGIQEQMVGVSQTAVQGRYIFSGDKMDSPAYTFNSSLLATNPVVMQSSAPATYRVEDPAGGSFAAAQSSQQIFDSSSGSAFSALNSLRLALLSGDTTSVTNSISSIKQASTQLNTALASYGSVENRIQTAITYAGSLDTQLRTQISQTEDADVTSAAMQFTQSSTQVQASLQMQGKMPHSSLFDYLG
ncbi:MAG TPA: flagellin [Bryobacteraceae bacterium]|nr:flagellin [Bryobacteraceae bacterium]